MVARSATIMLIVSLNTLCMYLLHCYLFILFRPRLSPGLSSSNTTLELSVPCKASPVEIHYTWRLPMPLKHPIDVALLCKAGTDGQLPCIDRWPMQAQGQIRSMTVFIIQCLPGSGKPWKNFQDKRQSWIPLHKLPTPPTFATFADGWPRTHAIRQDLMND